MQNIEQHIDFMGHFLEDINSMVAKLLEDLRHEYNVSMEQSQAVLLLDNNKSLTLSEITEKQGVNKAAISRRVKKLINLDLIQWEKQNASVDQRLKYVKLTPKGREYIERSKKIISEVAVYLVQDLSEKQIEDTAENLSIIDKRIKEYVKKNQL
ncbi:MarR family transcriptional regulator [Staphylococcus condimenti]|uniref:MarR family transcriptional regulator n=1 Tax=Staphylococcus condimenti TaxID=70255 RepID=A0A143PCZ3_9STAP|nr:MULTISPECIES: MarR family transcriptional regulator [Staphylococcus]AMY06397.1 MarR family transcriptional regulator [Staphylococcus condimenti]APR60279.1 MarR family transcriptional regulator [Staphylococcus condimenti]MDK8644261.1 MarR family transcriptional regulator [Staphylococcus condimenti]OFP00241.1 MarR family transcriptional regulator [Staphylococcus sp. HMSC065E08]PNZ59254.1 MarR family transcriptional regulator [Staphylococcus condimenti]